MTNYIKKGGLIKYNSKPSYKPYNLSDQKYTDIIENIIYNKEKMIANINKKKKYIDKLLS